jgi:hypothetical protein
MRKRLDIKGQVFGYYTVIDFSHIENKRTYWKCLCSCGTEKIVNGKYLANGDTKSCGCLAKETKKTMNKTHGNSSNGIVSKEYHTWSGMIARCTNPNHTSYSDYGGKGITVCDRWLSFENFLADMGSKPDRYSIERKDNSKGYNKENCIWADKYEQAANRSSSISVMHLETGVFYETVRAAANAHNLKEINLWRHILKNKCTTFVRI